MLGVAEKGREQEVIDIYEKWDQHAVIIREVVDTKNVAYYKDGELKADIPADSLVRGGGAPQYVREAIRPEYLEEVQAFDSHSLTDAADHDATVLTLPGTPQIASKECGSRWSE